MPDHYETVLLERIAVQIVTMYDALERACGDINPDGLDKDQFAYASTQLHRAKISLEKIRDDVLRARTRRLDSIT